MSETKVTASTPKTKPTAARRKPAQPPVSEAVTSVAATSAPTPVVPPAPVAEKPIAVAKRIAVTAKPAKRAEEAVADTEIAVTPPVAPAPEADAVVQEIIPPSKPVVEAPVSVVATKIASTPIPAFQQTVKFMATLPTPPFKGYEEIAAFSKANVDAFVQANAILVKGFEEFSKEIMELTKASMETATTTAKAVFAAKTIKDVVALQTDYTKTSFDKFVANSSKLSELGVKVAADAIAPVTARVNVAVEKVLKPAA